ncbi:MAG: hypothetical protein Q8Q14_09135 [Gemmatimonadales bacterium]|nr:hypothetical protein [Gemmatimonadales bacterium]
MGASSGSLLTASEVVVDTTVGGKVIVAASTVRRRVTIRNNGDNTGQIVFLGGAGVTVVAGFPLVNGQNPDTPGESYTFEGTGEVRGIVAAGTQAVRLLVEHD